jgi:hypothetical protein
MNMWAPPKDTLLQLIFFCMLWNVKEDVHFESYYIYQDDGTFSKILEKMQKKLKESWKICFFRCCKPVIMDPECCLQSFRSIWPFSLGKKCIILWGCLNAYN